MALKVQVGGGLNGGRPEGASPVTVNTWCPKASQEKATRVAPTTTRAFRTGGGGAGGRER